MNNGRTRLLALNDAAQRIAENWNAPSLLNVQAQPHILNYSIKVLEEFEETFTGKKIDHDFAQICVMIFEAAGFFGAMDYLLPTRKRSVERGVTKGQSKIAEKIITLTVELSTYTDNWRNLYTTEYITLCALKGADVLGYNRELVSIAAFGKTLQCIAAGLETYLPETFANEAEIRNERYYNKGSPDCEYLNIKNRVSTLKTFHKEYCQFYDIKPDNKDKRFDEYLGALLIMLSHHSILDCSLENAKNIIFYR